MYYVSINKRRVDGKEDHKVQDLSDRKIEEIGYKSPLFVFVT